jgi:hypothetical protein
MPCPLPHCRFIGPCNVSEGLEPGRLCIVDGGSVPVDDVSFAVSAGLDDASLFTFTSQSAGPLGGAFLSVGTQVRGGGMGVALCVHVCGHRGEGRGGGLGWMGRHCAQCGFVCACVWAPGSRAG